MNTETYIKVTFKPFGKRVLLRKDTKKIEKKGNIYLPANTKNENSTAHVVSIGSECKEDIHIGDEVIYENYSGQEFKYNSSSYIIVSCDNIVTKIK